MKDYIFKTGNSYVALVLRIGLGTVVFAHGAQKLFGWFGGYGFGGTMTFFIETVGLPWLLSLLVILLESVGALALIAGWCTRIVAPSLVLLAAGIVFTSHLEFGFFMNWFGNQGGEGYEFFILWIAIAAALTISGGGILSLDRRIHRNSPADRTLQLRLRGVANPRPTGIDSSTHT